MSLEGLGIFGMARVAHGLEGRPGVGRMEFLGAAIQISSLHGVPGLNRVHVGQVSGFQTTGVASAPAKCEVHDQPVSGAGPQNGDAVPVALHGVGPDLTGDPLDALLGAGRPGMDEAVDIQFGVAAGAVQVRALVGPAFRVGMLAVAAPAVCDGEVDRAGDHVRVVRDEEVHVAVEALAWGVVLEFRQREALHEHDGNPGLRPGAQQGAQFGADQGVPGALIQIIGAQGFPQRVARREARADVAAEVGRAEGGGVVLPQFIGGQVNFSHYFRQGTHVRAVQHAAEAAGNRATIARMWRPHPDLLITDLGDELVLMEPVRSVMFSLNDTGRLLWTALPASEAGLADVLISAYGLNAEQAGADVRTWLASLAERGLILSE